MGEWADAVPNTLTVAVRRIGRMELAHRAIPASLHGEQR